MINFEVMKDGDLQKWIKIIHGISEDNKLSGFLSPPGINIVDIKFEDKDYCLYLAPSLSQYIPNDKDIIHLLEIECARKNRNMHSMVRYIIEQYFTKKADLQ